jgi:WD40 repeat protein
LATLRGITLTRVSLRRAIALLLWPTRVVFGRDVFISYARSDAATYAAALANALRPHYSCYLDQHAVPRGEKLPFRVRREVYVASSLVLVGTPNATKSPWVSAELQRFLATGRSIFVVEVNEGLALAPWDQPPWTQLRGVFRQPESPEAWRSGQPSGACLEYLTTSFRFARQDQRLRRMTLSAAVFLLAVMATGGYVAWRANAAVTDAEKRVTEIGEREAAAQARVGTLEQSVGGLQTMAEEAKHDADRQGRIATSRKIAGSALAELESHPDLALLLAANAVRVAPTLEAQRSLFDTLRRRPTLRAVVRPPRAVSAAAQFGTFGPLALSRDGRWMTTTQIDGSASLWDITLQKPVVELRRSQGRVLTEKESRPVAAFSPDSALLAVSGGGEVALWDVRRRRQLGGFAASNTARLVFVGPQRLVVTRTRVLDLSELVRATESRGGLIPNPYRSSIEFWDVSRPQSPRRERALTERDDMILGMAANPNGQFLALLENQPRALRFCRLPLCESFETLLEDPQPGIDGSDDNALAIETAGAVTRLAVLRTDGSATLWDLPLSGQPGSGLSMTVDVTSLLPTGRSTLNQLRFGEDLHSLYVVRDATVRQVTLPGAPASMLLPPSAGTLPPLLPPFASSLPIWSGAPPPIAPGINLAMPMMSFQAAVDRPQATAYTARGVMITLQNDGSFAFWDAAGGDTLERRVPLPPASMRSSLPLTALSRDGHVVARAVDAELAIVELAGAGSPRHVTIPLGALRVRQLAVSADGEWIAGMVSRIDAEPPHEVIVWDRRGRRRAWAELPVRAPRAATFTALAFLESATGPRLAAAGVDGSVALWEFRPPSHLLLLLARSGFGASSISASAVRPEEVALSPSGETFVARFSGKSGQQAIAVWRAGSRVAELAVNGSLGALVVPDDRTLVAYVAGPQKVITRWNLEAGLNRPQQSVIDPFNPGWKPVTLPPLGSPGGLLSAALSGSWRWPAALSPKGDQLAYEEENTLFLWDVSATQPLVLFSKPTPSGATLQFAPDGNRLFAVTYASVTSVDLNVDALIAKACRIAGRTLTQTESVLHLDGQPDLSGCGTAP